MKILFCHIIDSNNVGDLASCPRNYLNFEPGVETFTFNIFEETCPPVVDAVIFGGGGMLHPNIDVRIYELRKWMLQRNPNCKFIIWGIGTNYHDIKHGHWWEWMNEFDLVGVRDYGSPYMWVPCASCLHPELKPKEEAPWHHVVCYEQHSIGLGMGCPTLTNRVTYESFGEVAKFLKTATIVLTNSFHGAYWALLVGSKAVIVNAFSNRFYCGLPKNMVTHYEYKLGAQFTTKPVDPEYRNLCINANLTMIARVNRLLGMCMTIK
jgi:hypothetical protein